MRSATNAYEAKARLYDRLKFELDSGAFDPLTNGESGLLTVDYAWSPLGGLWSIYFGGVRFEPGLEGGVAERNVLTWEIATVSIYIGARATPPPPDGVRYTDAVVSTIADYIASILARNPELGGGLSFMDIAGGEGDYATPDNEVESKMALRIRVGSYLGG